MPKRKNPSSGQYAAPKKRVVKPYTRWPHKGPPITEFKNVPKGWPAEDRDIHEDDVLANIERCKQRIEDGIMPQWWERKLKKYEACKAEFDKEIESAVPGLDPKVILRLRDLRTINSDLENAGDKRKLLPNVEAIIKAYNSKELTWNEGLVTYWSKGKKICDGPKKFKWEEFDSYSEEHQGHESFWVEGLHGPGALPAFLNYAPNKRAFTVAPRDAQFLHELDFALRIPSKPTQNSGSDNESSTEGDGADKEGHNEENGKEEDKEEQIKKDDVKSEDDEEDEKGKNDEEEEDPQDSSIEFTFIDDTGSAVMVLYEDDLEKLENKASEMAKIVGAARLNGAFGGWYVIIYRIEVNMRDQDGKYMLDWAPVQVAVINGDRPVGHMRMSGPWMRHRFFVGTSPNRKGILCIAKNKSLFVRQIEPVPKEDLAGVPADLRLPPNPPGALYAQYRGDAYPGEAIPGLRYDGDSDDNVAVRYKTAREDQPEESEESEEENRDGPVDTIET